jgi:uncharacterized phiE125 gp8 family phage protein
MENIGHWAIVPVSTGAPTGTVLEAEDLRSHLRLGAATTDAPDEDDVLESKLAAALRRIEGRLQRSLLNTEFDFAFDRFPCGVEPMRLPRWPLVSVQSVTSYDLDGVATVLSTAAYFVDTYSQPGRLCLKSGYTWPTGTRGQVAGVIRFTAGYGTDAMGVPDPLKEAVLKLATELYVNREAVSLGNSVNQPLPYGVEELLAEYELPEIG